MGQQNITKQFNIRKKIAKHGTNSIIVIPKLLQGELRPKMIVDIQIKVVEDMEKRKWQDMNLKNKWKNKALIG